MCHSLDPPSSYTMYSTYCHSHYLGTFTTFERVAQFLVRDFLLSLRCAPSPHHFSPPVTPFLISRICRWRLVCSNRESVFPHTFTPHRR